MANIHDILYELGITDYEIDGLGNDISNATEFKTKFRKVMNRNPGGQPTYSTDPNDFGVTWTQIKNRMNEIDNAAPALLLRTERNTLLRDTDWVVTKAIETGTSVPTNWKTYRQALRDLPASSTPKLLANGNLDKSSISWPTKPS
tara:strand:+ start:390 stop:824 length:435 start_codon:yes stop_codon:yes gene_type:complete